MTISGRALKEHEPPVTLTLTTRVPSKWLAVDMETGEAWEGTPAGTWARADAKARKEAATALSARSGENDQTISVKPMRISKTIVF